MNKENLFEQGYVEEELKKSKGKVSLKELPLTVFPSGCEYFLKLHNLFYDEIQSMNICIFLEDDKIIMIHFNCITSLRGKIYKQKELLKYNNNYNNYYSSVSNKYIRINYNISSHNISYIIAVVKLGFTLAVKTKRIFILPKFNCSKSFLYKKLRNKNCSFDELFDIHSLDKYLIDYYRENVYIIDIFYSNFYITN